jgi:hypothetical protein
MKLGAKVFGVLAGLSGLFLVIGFLLPGTWTAQVDTTLPGPPVDIFPYFNRMSLWPRWSTLPETGIEFFGGAEGVGAGLRWDDPQIGRGELRIIESRVAESVAYEVSVEGGTIRIKGSVRLSASVEGTEVIWREEGDFGRNPLLGYAALGMSESQAMSMQAALDSLRLRLQPTPPAISPL